MDTDTRKVFLFAHCAAHFGRKYEIHKKGHRLGFTRGGAYYTYDGGGKFFIMIACSYIYSEIARKIFGFLKNFHFFRDCVRAYFCGRPRGLEVEAARDCVDVQTFARKEKGIFAF